MQEKILTLSCLSLMALLIAGNARAEVFDTIKEIGKTGIEISGAVKGQATSSVTETPKARKLSEGISSSRVILIAKNKANQLLFFIVQKIDKVVRPDVNMYEIYVRVSFRGVAKAFKERLQILRQNPSDRTRRSSNRKSRHYERDVQSNNRRYFGYPIETVGLTLSEPVDVSLGKAVFPVSGEIFNLNMNLNGLRKRRSKCHWKTSHVYTR